MEKLKKDKEDLKENIGRRKYVEENRHKENNRIKVEKEKQEKQAYML